MSLPSPGHSALPLSTPTLLSFKMNCPASLPKCTWGSSQELLVWTLSQSFMDSIPAIWEPFKLHGHLNLFPIRPDSLSDPRPFGSDSTEANCLLSQTNVLPSEAPGQKTRFTGVTLWLSLGSSGLSHFYNYIPKIGRKKRIWKFFLDTVFLQ